jgi:hypothetical protein
MIKGQRQGRQVYYTRRQLENVCQGIPSKLVKAFKAKKTARTKGSQLMLFDRSVLGPFVYLLLMEGLIRASEENRTPDSSLGNPTDQF